MAVLNSCHARYRSRDGWSSWPAEQTADVARTRPDACSAVYRAFATLNCCFKPVENARSAHVCTAQWGVHTRQRFLPNITSSRSWPFLRAGVRAVEKPFSARHCILRTSGMCRPTRSVPGTVETPMHARGAHAYACQHILCARGTGECEARRHRDGPHRGFLPCARAAAAAAP